MRRETKDCKLELKAVNDDGTFSGYLSVYDVVDLGNDLVEKGAFTKTIQENKGVIPLLHNHDLDRDMGLLHLSDDEYGLKVDGEMFVAESALARERHAMAKKYHAAGRPVGLSIGYEAVKKLQDKGIRRLKELKLYEGSMTLWPMLPVAQIESIKTLLSGETKGDFATEFQRIQVVSMRGQMMNALYWALDSIVYGYDGMQSLSAEEKVQATQDSIDQFRTAYLENLPVLLEMWGEKSAQMIAEQKAGRRISASTRADIEDAISKLSALLQGEETTSDEEAGKSLSGAATETNEPDALHSMVIGILRKQEAA